MTTSLVLLSSSTLYHLPRSHCTLLPRFYPLYAPLSSLSSLSLSLMASLSSSDDDDFPTQPCRSYSVSADVSDSDTSSSFSCCRLHSDLGGASSSPFIAGIAMPSPLVLPVIVGEDGFVWDGKDQKEETDSSEVDMMMERFSKLLLGEDMSGGGKGVCTALAISNAITNLAATVFGELWRLEPLAPQKKKMWCREMEWLLCVSDSIVELVPSVQPFPSGGMFEVMALRPRLDLYMNLPALKKLDAMLLGMLDGFKDTEFWYVDRGISIPEPEEHDMHQPGMCVGRPSEDKWWLPSPKVPPNGLSEEGRKRLHRCRDCTNQILKAAMAINSSVLAEMEVPSAYLETLPTKGRDGLGETIYRYITADQFSPDCLLDRLNLSSEHRTREVVNRVEATVHLWKQKGQRNRASHSKTKRSSWGGKVKGLVTGNEKYQALARRAETLLRSLKLRFPSLPQTALDMSKIQYNKDVGQAILESYSRVIESLAFNIMARIDDLLSADDAAKQTALAQANSIFNRAGFTGLQKRISPSPFSIHHTPNFGSPFATPSFSSTPPGRSPLRSLSSMSKSAVQAAEDSRLEKSTVVEFERIWSCPRNLSVRKSYRDTPERD